MAAFIKYAIAIGLKSVHFHRNTQHGNGILKGFVGKPQLAVTSNMDIDAMTRVEILFVPIKVLVVIDD